MQFSLSQLGVQKQKKGNCNKNVKYCHLNYIHVGFWTIIKEIFHWTRHSLWFANSLVSLPKLLRNSLFKLRLLKLWKKSINCYAVNFIKPLRSNINFSHELLRAFLSFCHVLADQQTMSSTWSNVALLLYRHFWKEFDNCQKWIEFY